MCSKHLSPSKLQSAMFISLYLSAYSYQNCNNSSIEHEIVLQKFILTSKSSIRFFAATGSESASPITQTNLLCKQSNENLYCNIVSAALFQNYTNISNNFIFQQMGRTHTAQYKNYCLTHSVNMNCTVHTDLPKSILSSCNYFLTRCNVSPTHPLQ